MGALIVWSVDGDVVVADALHEQTAGGGMMKKGTHRYIICVREISDDSPPYAGKTPAEGLAAR